jgi:hypothetical protein
MAAGEAEGNPEHTSDRISLKQIPTFLANKTNRKDREIIRSQGYRSGERQAYLRKSTEENSRTELTIGP